MNTAPQGRLIVVSFFEDAERVVEYWDLSDTKDCIYSSEEIASCWRDRHGNCFETYDAIGWREVGAIDLLKPIPALAEHTK